MAKDNEKKVTDGVQGTPPITEETANQQDPDFGGSAADKTPDGQEPVAETPEWVNQVLESNQRVIDSNNEVIEAITSFNENAKGVVKDILASAEGTAKKEEKRPEPVINRKAKYVVSMGKKFADKEAGGTIREAGFDVSKFAPERIKSLIEQGIVEEQN